MRFQPHPPLSGAEGKMNQNIFEASPEVMALRLQRARINTLLWERLERDLAELEAKHRSERLETLSRYKWRFAKIGNDMRRWNIWRHNKPRRKKKTLTSAI